MNSPLAALLFDMDGTLIDTEPFWHRAQERIFAGIGIHGFNRAAIGFLGAAQIGIGSENRGSESGQ